MKYDYYDFVFQHPHYWLTMVCVNNILNESIKHDYYDYFNKIMVPGITMNQYYVDYLWSSISSDSRRYNPHQCG